MGPEAVVGAVATQRRQAAVGGVALQGGVELALVHDRLRLAASGEEATDPGHVVARPHQPPAGEGLAHRVVGAAGEVGGAAHAQRQQDVAEHGVRMDRSEEHTSELQSLMRISYAVFCLKKKKIYELYQ